jgi:signal transduction histidine kinase
VRRPRSLILIFTATILLAVAALQVTDLWWRRAKALKAADARAQNLSSILAEYVRGSFALADTSLRQLVIHGRRVGGARASREEWDPILKAAQTALAGSGSVSVTDADGIIRYSTLPAVVGQSRKDTYVFQHLSSDSDEDLIVDRPFPARDGRYVLPVGRRLETPDGRFDGLVVSVVIPDAFREYFRTVDVGQEGAIWVFHPDGVVLFREPSPASHINESAADNPLLRAALGHGTGVLRGPVEKGGISYLSGYKALGSPPLIVAVSLSQREVLADWRSQARTTATGFGALSIALIALALILKRQTEQLAAALTRETETRREIEAAGRLKDEFLMTLSHELRTPLNAILGWSRMLTTGTVPEERRAQALAAIERNAQAQTRLVEDLLDVSRGLGGKLHIEPREVDVAEVVLGAAETLRPAMLAKRISFTVDVDRTLPPIQADPDRLQQVVWNLLSNAIKFTPERGSVQLRAAAAGTNVEIVVRDSGVGIDPDFLPFVFERFRQADARLNREFGGLGLGLSIARHLVELHGGSLSVHSEGLGHGAAFRVLLPRGPAGG